MIQRVVAIQLEDQHRNEASMASIIEQTKEVLPRAKGVLDVSVGRPADERTRREWDLFIFVRFEDLAAVEAYRIDEVHRSYADVFLKPLRKKIRAWNLEIA